MADPNPYPAPAFVPQAIDSPHWLRFPGPEGRVLFRMTGVAVFGPIRGPRGDWLRETVYIPVQIGQLCHDKVLELEHWTVLVTLNSISYEHEAVDVGWAVDGFSLLHPDAGQRDRVWLTASVAVRNKDGYLARLGYAVDLFGYEVELP